MHDQTAETAAQTEIPAALPLRHDTILGVCQGIGEDLGISPTWLRLAFAAMLFVQPVWTIAAYLLLGLLVAAARLLAPDAYPKAVARPRPSEGTADTGAGEEQIELPLAA